MKYILLVEPAYKNKYPPLGLMKISAYHKQKGDWVVFVKGTDQAIAEKMWDRIYITTLFTFDFDICVKTIRFYKNSVRNVKDIYVGGILASLLTDELKEAAYIDNVIPGQITDARVLGYDDDTNIDEIVPDYDILDCITYRYPAQDAYFLYTTRGCPNRCSFCCVPRLEPEFRTINNVHQQICSINQKYGSKRNLVLLDNNILHSPDLGKIVDEIIKAGFVRGKTYVPPTPLDITVKRITLGGFSQSDYANLLVFLKKIDSFIRNEDLKTEFNKILFLLDEAEDKSTVIMEYYDFIFRVVGKYNPHSKRQRYVDFNQGLDASLLNKATMQELSKIPVKPIRIAFDFLTEKKEYKRAVRLAYEHGISEVSNYMLFNFEDKPEDLWQRLIVNVELSETLGIHIFSFPMKYVPLNAKNRSFIGYHWNAKYLKSIFAIMHVTNGVVPCDVRTFFEKAFGASIKDYLEILAMPKDLITYRFHYENLGVTQEWRERYRQLDPKHLQILLSIVGQDIPYIRKVLSEEQQLSSRIREILPYYLIQYKREIQQDKKRSK